MSGAHSILPPSGAAAWSRCGLWVRMNQAYPKADTPESMEGNAAHWVFAKMLQDEPVTAGDISLEGVVITDEMIEGGELLVETVRNRMHGMELHVESAIAIPRIHEKCWGTPDVWAVDSTCKVLEVIDYKYGHRFVDEYENEQGVAYVAGIIDALSDAPGLLDQVLTVNFTIVQPRCFLKGAPVRTWTVKASDLRAQINKLKRAAELSLDANPVATTNSECRDCHGRHACPALQQAAYADAEYSAMSSPVELTPAAASLELKMMERALDRLQARVEGMREAVTGYARQGQVVPYHHIEQGFGRQQWSLPAEQVVAMGQLMGADLSKPRVVTPKQALKLGIDEAVINAYSVTPLGSIKLVSDNPADARRVFGLTK